MSTVLGHIEHASARIQGQPAGCRKGCERAKPVAAPSNATPCQRGHCTRGQRDAANAVVAAAKAAPLNAIQGAITSINNMSRPAQALLVGNLVTSISIKGAQLAGENVTVPNVLNSSSGNPAPTGPDTAFEMPAMDFMTPEEREEMRVYNENMEKYDIYSQIFLS